MVSIVKTEDIKELDAAQLRLTELLKHIPGLTYRKQPKQIRVTHNGQQHTLILEIQRSAEPRLIRGLSATLYETNQSQNTYSILVAPWISPESRQILERAGIGYVDLEGNARIAFGGVYIERLGAPAPKVATRELRTLWKPASARALRTLLREPTRDWNLLQLAEASQISHAHAHKVKTQLLRQDWLEEMGKARFKTIRLTAPAALLEAWRFAYRPPSTRSTWFTPLEREAVEDRLRKLHQQQDGRIALAGFSAARLLAPYVRGIRSEFLYADETAIPTLRKSLELEPVERGENLIVYHEPGGGALLDAISVSGMLVTSPIQTYLDLGHADGRSANGSGITGRGINGRAAEAAQHLFDTRIAPNWTHTSESE
jgi:hypothetical protein